MLFGLNGHILKRCTGAGELPTAENCEILALKLKLKTRNIIDEIVIIRESVNTINL